MEIRFVLDGAGRVQGVVESVHAARVLGTSADDLPALGLTMIGERYVDAEAAVKLMRAHLNEIAQ